MENDSTVPEYCSIISSDKKYFFDTEDISIYEQNCLKALDYKLNYYTVYDALCIILNCGIVTDEEAKRNKINVVEKIYQLTFNILEEISFNEIFMNYNPLKITLAIVSIARNHFNKGRNSESHFDLIKEFFEVDNEYYEICAKEIIR